MVKLKFGDIQCTTQKLADSRFQEKLIIVASVLEGRDKTVYLCPEIDDSEQDAMRRAIDYATWPCSGITSAPTFSLSK